jgi:hypothetical protein
MYAQQLNGWEELWRWISNTFKVEHKGKTSFTPPLPHVGICHGSGLWSPQALKVHIQLFLFFTYKGFQGIVAGQGHDQMMTGILQNCLQLQMVHLTPNLSKISFSFQVAICPCNMWQTFATNMPMVYGLVIKHL